jgi:protein gp37
MGENTNIEWAHHTWNPWWGCSNVSPGCDHCYAEALDKRFGGGHWGPHAARRRTTLKNWKAPLKWDLAARSVGLRHRVFTCSMADFFDNQVEPQWRAEAWDMIRVTPNLTWLVLTKRPQNIAAMLPDGWGQGWPNVWLGTSVENQDEADRRIPVLLSVPARKHFLSCEPLLGPVDLHSKLCRETGSCPVCPVCFCAIDWVIVGGESGPDARPMNPQWARDIHAQCITSGAAFFFKQWGEWASVSEVPGPGEHFTFPDDRSVRRVGKVRAGRMLDGQQWSEVPA